MSDERIRRAERLAGAGDRAAQAQVLRERVRIGELTRERLDLAAYCGDAVAREAIGVGSPAVDRGVLFADGQVPVPHRAFVRGLPEVFDRGICVRAAWTAAEWSAVQQGLRAEDVGTEALLLRLAGWLRNPTQEEAEDVLDALEREKERMEIPEDETAWWQRPVQLLLLRAPVELRAREVVTGEGGWAFFMRLSFEAAAEALIPTDPGSIPAEAFDAAREPHLIRLTVGVSRELTAWALGG